jgi:hypothetical protein
VTAYVACSSPRGASGFWEPGGGGCLVQRDEVQGAAAVAARLDLRLGDDRQVELGAVGELGEDPPDPLAGGSAPVP